MYENMTLENIKQQMVEALGDKVSGAEGSFVNNMLSPVAYQLWLAYQEFNKLLDIMFMDTSDGEYVERRCKEEGIEWRKGTPATGELTFYGTAGTVMNENPSFDRDITGWAPREGARLALAAGGRNDSNALLVDVSRAVGSNERQTSPQQTVRFESDATYTLSVFLRLPEGTDYENSYAVMVDASASAAKPVFTYQDGTDTSGAENYPTLVRNTRVSADGWTELTETFTVKSRAGEAVSEGKLYIQRNVGEKTNYYIDDFRLIKHEKGLVIPAGTIVQTGSGLQYKTRQAATIGAKSVTVPAESTEPGSKYNVPAGEIDNMVVNIAGVSGVKNEAPFTGGTDTESIDTLKGRYFLKKRKSPASGNAPDYIRWATEVPGVETARVYPLWDGNGTVKVVLAGKGNLPVGADTLAAVQAHIEEERPIGAKVDVVNTKQVPVSVSATVYLDGVSLADVQADFYNRLQAYFSSFDGDRVLYNKISSILINSKGVDDFYDLFINDGYGNIPIADDEMPVAGTITLTEKKG